MIETNSLSEWTRIVKERFSPDNTILNVSEEAITILESRGNKNTILARWCKTSKYGVVLERRQHKRYVAVDRRKKCTIT